MSQGLGLKESSAAVSVSRDTPTRATKAETEITGMVPKKESAAMAPMAGTIQMQPLKMLVI